MKTVGFIDYYLSEWHANNYPAWIDAQSGGEFRVVYAYALSEPPIEGRLSNAQWAEKYGIELVDSEEELIRRSDCIVVLSPDNSELHYQLSKKALESGKPVYIDKTFADSKAEAERIFAVAAESGAPCFSSSALRFSEKLKVISHRGIRHIQSCGGGQPDNYIIHQLEPISILMEAQPEAVCYSLDESHRWQLRYADGRTASMEIPTQGGSFRVKVDYEDHTVQTPIDDPFFQHFIDDLIHFFRTSEVPVTPQETIDIMALREVCLRAMSCPEQWVSV